MKRIFILLSIFLAVAFGALAADYSVLAPYVNDKTFLILRIDVSKLDPAMVLEKLSEKPATEVSKQWDDFRKQSQATGRQIAEMKNEFTDAGGREIFLFMALEADELKTNSMIVIPLENNADARGIIQAMKMAELDDLRIKGKVVAGRLRKEALAIDIKAVDRPDIKAAIEELADAPLGLAFVAPAEIRKVFVELEPELPKVLGGGATADLLGPLVYAAGKLSDPDKMEITVLLKSDSKPATEKMAKSLESIRDGLLKTPEFKEFYPVIAAFKPQVKDDRVVMPLDSTIPLLLVTEMQRADQATKMYEARNLTMICNMWANEHNKVYPTMEEIEPYAKKNQINLKTRTQWVYLRPEGLPKSDQILFHEAASPWPGRVVVGFGDVHVEVLTDQKQFEELLAKYKGK